MQGHHIAGNLQRVVGILRHHFHRALHHFFGRHEGYAHSRSHHERAEVVSGQPVALPDQGGGVKIGIATLDPATNHGGRSNHWSLGGWWWYRCIGCGGRGGWGGSGGGNRCRCGSWGCCRRRSAGYGKQSKSHKQEPMDSRTNQPINHCIHQ